MSDAPQHRPHTPSMAERIMKFDLPAEVHRLQAENVEHRSERQNPDQHDVLDHVDDTDRRSVRAAVTPSPDRTTDVKPRGEQRRKP